MSTSKPVIRLFISSTFSDFKAERDLLHDKVYPRLRELCTQHGARFQAIDLRWGVNESAAVDQRTMQVCLEEIERCQTISPKPNFLVLLGDRYGWQPIPDTIAADEFDAVYKEVSTRGAGEALACLEKWYQRDDNAVPPQYVLQPRTDQYVTDYAAWETEEYQLRNTFREAVQVLKLSDIAQIKYNLSATGQEIFYGALDPALPEVDQHVFGFYRQIEGLPSDENAIQAKDYIDLYDGQPDSDARARLDNLKANLKNLLPQNISEYAAKWTGADITKDHLEAFCVDVYEKLERVIKSQLAEIEQVPTLVREISDHETFAIDRIKSFTGREAELAEINKYLAITEETNTPIIVHAASGSGKSAFMAEAARSALEHNKDAVQIKRFISVTPSSSNPVTLIRSMLEQIAEAYEQSASDVPTEKNELLDSISEYFSYASEEKPLYVFIDALDQLNALSDIKLSDWLPETLPQFAHLIISTTVEIVFEEVKHRLKDAHYLVLSPMSADEGDQLLTAWLNTESRRLTTDQRQNILTGFSKNGLPLYLKLAFEQAKYWHSYDKVSALQGDARNLVSNLVAQLSHEHAARLVDRVFDYLAVSRHGLTEDELLDVLSLDEDVMHEFNEGAFHEYPVESLPVVIWSRLHADIKHYLIEKDIDGVQVLGFFHRQFMEVAVEECLESDEIPVLSKRLSNYFSAQNNFLDAERQRPNTRKLMELPYNLRRSEQWEQLEDTLTEFDFCMAKCQLNEADDLVEDYRQAYKSIPEPSDAFRMWEAFMRERSYILRRGYERWSANKILLQLAVEHADDSPVTTAAEKWLGEDYCDWSWLRNQQRVAHAQSDPCLCVFEGHTGFINGAIVLHDGRILSWSKDKTLRLWSKNGQPLVAMKRHMRGITNAKILSDGRILSRSTDYTQMLWSNDGKFLGETLDEYPDDKRSKSELSDGNVISWSSEERTNSYCLELSDCDGQLLSKLTGHTHRVLGALVLSDDRILSWSSDCTLRLWDSNGSSLGKSLTGHTFAVIGAMILSDGHFLSWSSDHTLRLWSNEGESLGEPLTGHTGWINDVTVLPDGRILSCSSDHTLRLWGAEDQQLNLILLGHTDKVNGTTVLSDGRILSWSDDCTLRLWDKEGKALQKLIGHTDRVCDAMELHNGHILSWSWDNTLRIWDSHFQEVDKLDRHTRNINSVMVLPENNVVSCSSDHMLRLWNHKGKSMGVPLEGHTASVDGSILLHNGQILSWSKDDRTLRLWSKEGRSLSKPFIGHTESIIGVTALRSGHILSWSWDGTLRLWNHNGESLAVFSGHTTKINGAIEIDDKRILSWSDDGTLRIWNIDTLSESAALIGHTSTVNGAMMLADGRIISWSWNDHALRLWNTEGELLSVLSGHDGAIHSVIELSDERLLSWSYWDRTIRLWNSNGKTISVINQEAYVIAIMSEDRVLVETGDKSIQLWDIESGKCLDSCFIDDAPFIHPEWLAILSPKMLAENRKMLLFDSEYYCGVSGLDIDMKFVCLWHGRSKIKAHHLSNDGTVVVSLESGHVFLLKLYFGNIRCSLSDTQ